MWHPFKILNKRDTLNMKANNRWKLINPFITYLPITYATITHAFTYHIYAPIALLNLTAVLPIWQRIFSAYWARRDPLIHIVATTQPIDASMESRCKMTDNFLNFDASCITKDATTPILSFHQHYTFLSSLSPLLSYPAWGMFLKDFIR